MAKKFKVLVKVAPLSGKATKKDVKVAAHASVREVLEAANIDPSRKDIFVDGCPADLDEVVTSENSISVSEAEAEAPAREVTVNERPQGS